MKLLRLVLNGIFLLALLITQNLTVAQATVIQCGDIIEGEFTDEYQEQFYEIELSFGDELTVSGTSLEREGLLAFAIVLYEPDGHPIIASNFEAESMPTFETSPLESRGLHIIKIVNTDIDNGSYPSTFGAMKTYRNNSGGVGRYALYIRCALRDGIVIEPGESGNAQATGQLQQSAPAFSGFGFPGLAPVDFASAFRLPLALGTQSEGEIPVTGNAILGFYFTGNANDVFDLSFERVSGNLNLGLVVLSAQNQVAYMAALVSSQTMNSRFTLPASGEYTIGLFRIDLIPPSTPEATRFRILATLNP